jgi:hypothetical protein
MAQGRRAVMGLCHQTAPAVVSRCLHNLVDETAQARPDAMAIEGADGRMIDSTGRSAAALVDSSY